MKNYIKYVVRIFFALFFPLIVSAQEHPSLLITKANLPALREGVKEFPLLKNSFLDIQQSVDDELINELLVPTPQDAGGGYTHELHKKNYQLLLNSAICFQVTQDVKYLNLSKNILTAYAERYQDWPEHPKRKENHPSGRIFWQNLNDCVWLVNAIQAYDLIVSELSSQEREIIEKDLFIPMAEYLMISHKAVFDKIHNHGTWSIAAVGITGLILNKPEWVNKSLYGSALDKQTGFLKQLDELFSPDGYYAEGPYYQRYALSPFVLFAKALHNYKPELHIFEYRNRLLAKAIETVFQTSYTNGLLFPLNDAIKDKSIKSNELILANNIAYSDIDTNPTLLGMAKRQNKVIISDAGLKLARDIFLGKSKNFDYKTTLIRDGKDGKKGGIGILRHGDEDTQQTLVLKNTTHGMGHGHFDRLNFLLYDNGFEVFPDYGAARFLNIESKSGGHYLKENNTWAKQSIAHNTIVINEASQFDGNVDRAEHFAPTHITLYDHDTLKYVIASESHAYPQTKISRALITIQINELKKPLIVDVSYIHSDNALKTVDLPYYYIGQVVDQRKKDVEAKVSLHAFGEKNGYQHLWLNSSYGLQSHGDYITLLSNYKFYKVHFASQSPHNILNHVHLGADDPQLNLIPTRGIVLRQENLHEAVFAQLIETYGDINPTDETISDANPAVKNFKITPAEKNNFNISFEVGARVFQLETDLTDNIISNIKIEQL